MVEVGPLSGTVRSRPVADLSAFVDLLAARGQDRATRLAREKVLEAIARDDPPPGIRLLAEALMTAASERPPAPRQPGDDPAAVATALVNTSFLVLEDFGPEAVAAAVSGLVDDGRRVVVTAATPAELAAVREVLPPATADRALDGLPLLPPAALRRLRLLLATSTPARRARYGQQVPARDMLPPVAEVAELCRRVEQGRTSPAGAAHDLPDPAALVPDLVRGLQPDKRVAITSVARNVDRTLGALRSRNAADWAWSLLADLVYSARWPQFERLMEQGAETLAHVARLRSAPPVTFAAHLPAEARDLLHRYEAFLESGGRPRTYFRSGLQRDVEPVLRRVRVAGAEPETAEDVRLVLEHLALGDRLAEFDAGCARIGVPPPRDPARLAELINLLTAVAAAARAVASLRHEVLFLHPGSPVAIPDLLTAERVAAVIREHGEQTSPTMAAAALDRMAHVIEVGSDPHSGAPEVGRAVAALRARDAAGYAEAFDALAAARREIGEEQQVAALLTLLREQAPRLADAWAAPRDEATGGLGFAAFVPLGPLLEELPQPDSADAVLVLGADRLGVERLLLAAVAPRLVGVAAPGSRAHPPAAPSLLTVLQRASRAVIRSSTGRVGRLPGRTSEPPAPRGTVDRAGA